MEKAAQEDGALAQENAGHVPPVDTATSVDLADGGEYPGLLRTIVIVSGVALSLLLIGLDMTIVATAIPAITSTFPGIDLIGWYSAAFFIVLAAAQPVWGRVYQYFSIKYAFIVAVCIFEVGSLLAGVAPNSIALIIGRAITGAGAAGIATGGYAIMPIVLRPHLRPVFTGLVTTIYSVAQAIGPLAGGALSGNVTWRWCFYINLPLGAVAGFIMLFSFHGPKEVPAKNQVTLREKLLNIDYLGSLLIVGALVCYTRALQVAGITVPWNSSQVIGLLVGAFLLFLALCGVERVLGDRAMIVHKLLTTRLVIVGMVYGFFFEAAAYSILYAIPLHFQVIDGISITEAGIHNVPFLLACGVGSMAAGWVFSRTRLAHPVIIFACGGAAIGTGLIYTLDVDSPSSQWIGYQVLAGLAYGAGLPLGIILGQSEAEPEDIPTSTSLLLMSFNIGSALALGAAQSLLDNLLFSHLAILAPSVNPADVLTAGATAVRSTFSPDVVPGIIGSYLYGLRAIYILDIAFAGMALVAGLFYPWKRLSVKK